LASSKRERPIGKGSPSTTMSGGSSSPSRSISTAAKCPFKSDGPSFKWRPTSFAAPLSTS
jgi:hypothetical protein